MTLWFRQKKRCILLLPLLLSWMTLLSLSGQRSEVSAITGVVTDQISGLPVSDATIYVNESSLGVHTQQDGRFSLIPLMIPCQVIVSHISYQPVVLEVTRADTMFRVKLSPRVYSLPVFEISNQSDRNIHLAFFRDWFLGSDEWGKNARILNEEALNFLVVPRPMTLEQQARNPNAIRFNPISFEGEATAPIVVELPLLGYQVMVDLVRFKVADNRELKLRVGDYSAYFYFKQLAPNNGKEKRQIIKNRFRAYQNSSMHFLRSLLQNNLAGNGYELFGIPTEQENSSEFSLETFNKNLTKYTSEGTLMQLQNMKGLKVQILYHYNHFGYSILPEESSPDMFVSPSQLHLLSDRCLIRANGTTPDNNLLFIGSIGEKKVGAMLPSDYNPRKD